jgi:alpha-beta hydrolase superfamily lysophospholipase
LSGVATVALVGLRLGGLLAATSASERGDVAGLVLWGTALAGKSFVREMRAWEQFITGEDPIPDEVPEGAVAAAGFVLTRETVLELATMEMKALGRSPSPTVLIVPRDDVPAGDQLRSALENLGARVEESSLPGYAAMMRDAHNAEVPTEAILGITNWLRALPSATTGTAPRAPAEAVLRHVSSPVAAMDVRLPGNEPGAIREQPFFAAGGRLFGILSLPEAGPRPGRPAIVLTNAGSVHRIGSNRLYVTLARSLAERGFSVLRLDIGGLGDSRPAAGMAENIPYSARAVPDIGEAAVALRRQLECDQVIVAGLCSGAHAAFHAALELDHVAGIMMFNPIVFYWKPSDALDVAAWMTFRQLHRYKTGVVQLDVWRKLVRGQVDIRLFWRTLRDRVWDRAVALDGRARRRMRRLFGPPPGTEDAGHDLQRMCKRGLRVFLLFSEDEPGHDFLKINHPGDLKRLKRTPGFSLYLVPRHGHTFTSIAAQREVLTAVTGQLVDWYR